MIISYLIPLLVLIYTFIGFFTYQVGGLIQQDLLSNFAWALAAMLWILGARFEKDGLMASGMALMVLFQGGYFAIGLFSRQLGPVTFTTLGTGIAGVFFALSLYALFQHYRAQKIIEPPVSTTNALTE